MPVPFFKRLLPGIRKYEFQNILSESVTKRHEALRRWLRFQIFNRSQSQPPWGIEDDAENPTDAISRISFHGDYASDSKWGLELAWVNKAVEPALKLCKWVLPSGVGNAAPSSWSVSEMISLIQKSKLVIGGWSLSDMTIGLYLIYLRQASLNLFEDVKAERVSSEFLVQDLIYNLELAKGCYKTSIHALARQTMLREKNIVKFVSNSSFMRPGYYIAVDPRRKLVILGIRGTQTVYDLITDIISSGGEELNFEGYLTHFGTTEAARWFLANEISTIRSLLGKHEGFKLRLVGHSLGAATASLLAIMLRKQSQDALGFSPDIVSAVGYATPPCVSKELAESCSDFVTTTVMQDDVVPRLSAASLERLRNDIVQTDWSKIIEREDWKRVVGLVTNAKQVAASVQDVARKLADYASFGNSDSRRKLADDEVSRAPAKERCRITDELYVPGSVYFLKREVGGSAGGGDGRRCDFFVLLKRPPREHFQRIVLSGNVISDHKCDSHYYALRDAMKDFPCTTSDCLFG